MVRIELPTAVAEEVLVEHPDATGTDYAVNLWWRRSSSGSAFWHTAASSCGLASIRDRRVAFWDSTPTGGRRRHMKRTAIAAWLAAATVGFLASPAAAQPPSGSATTCPPRYTPMTLPELIAQAAQLGLPAEAPHGLFARVNKNGDSWICQRKLPGDETSFNFIDNPAVGLGRIG